MFKLSEVSKARRKKPRPEWQDVAPASDSLKDYYDIARKHERRFSDAYRRASSAVVSDESSMVALRRAVVDQDMKAALNALPFLNENDLELPDFWQNQADKLEAAYGLIMTEGGNDAYKERNIPLRFEVQKAATVIPPNPFSIRWIQSQVFRQMTRLSAQQKKVLQAIILDGYENGDRVEVIMERIREEIGLLPQNVKQLRKIERTMEDAGASREAIDRALAKKRAFLISVRAAAIARTETVAAQAQGRLDAWQVAKEQGLIPEGVVQRWKANTRSLRTCKICRELNNNVAPLDQPFYSRVLNTPVRAPPSHINCRCTVVLTDIPGA